MQVLFFIMGIMVKLCDTDGVNTVHSLLDTQVEASTFCFTLVGVHTAEAVAWLILCAGLLVVLVPLGLLVQKLVFSQSLPILRDAQTMEPPVLLLRAGERYHLFLSHVWSTGQDQCAVVKRQLQLLLPGVAIFLDVDGAAHSIRSSPAFPPNPLILERCFIPCDPSCCRFAGYWRLGGLRARDGRDTLLPVEELLHLAQLPSFARSYKASIEEKRPLVLVHEQQEDKGGGPLQMMRMETVPRGDARVRLRWAHANHVAPHRALYQNLTLKFIATEMLRHGPKYTMIRCTAHHHSSCTAHHHSSQTSLPQLIVTAHATPQGGTS